MNRGRFPWFPVLLGSLSLAVLLLVVGLDLRAGVRGAYLGAFWWMHLSLGATAMVFVGDLTGGRWFRASGSGLGRLSSGVFGAVPLLGLTLLGLGFVFPWATGEAGLPVEEGNSLWLTREDYFQVPFFLGRSAAYAVVFLGLAWLAGAVMRRRVRGDAGSSPWSGPALVAYAVGMFFFSVDYVMSLEPHWYSTGMPVILSVSQAFSACGMAVLCGDAGAGRGQRTTRDLASLLTALSVFWFYVAFVQFLIIWMGNLSHDISWYLHRSGSAWIAVVLGVFVLNLMSPLFLFLLPPVKTSPNRVRVVSALLLIGQALFAAWALLPSFAPLDEETLWAGLVGVCLASSGAAFLARAGIRSRGIWDEQ